MNSDTSHGWVLPRPDGARAVCGGPTICPTCRTEQLHDAMLTAFFGPAQVCQPNPSINHRERRKQFTAIAFPTPKGETMQLQLPPLAEGEIYVGAVGGQQGNVHHLILLPGDNEDSPWQAQMDWAKSIGGDLPTKVEQAMLWNTCRDQFKEDWYWSNQPYELKSSYAWYQGFDVGCQGLSHKVAELRARAVRRLPI